jgi:enoyl-CoA hydratase/carnithine racemase
MRVLTLNRWALVTFRGRAAVRRRASDHVGLVADLAPPKHVAATSRIAASRRPVEFPKETAMIELEELTDVTYEVDRGLAWITINRPDRFNAFRGRTVDEMISCFSTAWSDGSVGVVALTGAGDRAFCAGADLTGMASGASFLDLHEGRGELARLFQDMWSLGKPTVARVRGFALAGGFGLALACDFVVCSDDSQFGTPEINVGLWPYMITVPLVRSMPPKKALELMLTGRRVGADEALRIGFVNQVVPASELDAAVDSLASDLASKSPAIVKLGRDSFYGVWDLAAREALAQLHSMLTITSMTEDAAEGIAAFAEKRAPQWTGR